jgi:hypothetical protein
MKRSLIFSFFCFALFSFSQGQNYSIKNRLNTKLSLSFNRTNEINIPLIEFDKIHPFQARLNMRAECNYGVLNWLELGIYIGYIRYEKPHLWPELPVDSVYLGGEQEREIVDRIGFAPTFGINANVHLLPFFGLNKDCRWEWYLTAKYGGTYLRHHLDTHTKGFRLDSQGKYVDFEYYFNEKRYRHEFGIGMGGGVYFWNVFGIYAEALVGQYSYFPEAYGCDFSARVGVECKFMPKNKEKNSQAKLR